MEKAMGERGKPRTGINAEVYLDLRDKILNTMMKVDRGYKTKCWIWLGDTKWAGSQERPYLLWAGKSQLAYRAAYEEWFGIIPKGKWACHLCDQSTCVNPFHIYLGDPVRNADDRAIRYYNGLSKETTRLAIKHLLASIPKRTETPMQELYNCKTVDSTHYRITKFDKHLDPRYDPKGKQSSYIVSKDGCDCPQGNAPKCRHRKMLPSFIEHGYVDTEYFFVWDTQQWYKPTGIFAEARKANGRNKSKVSNDPLLTDQAPGALFLHSEADEALANALATLVPNEGAPKAVSAAPSPQPSTTSKTYRRF